DQRLEAHAGGERRGQVGGGREVEEHVGVAGALGADRAQVAAVGGQARLGGALVAPQHAARHVGVRRDEDDVLEGGEGDGSGDLLLVSRRDDRERSEEHTSELQSRENLVCRLLLEKKNKKLKQKENNVIVECC